MSLKFRYIVVLAWLILDCYVLSLSARLNIERRENGDLFDNSNCNSSAGVKCSCKVFINTECDDSTCKRCRCSSEYTTLLSSNDNKGGVCVKDRRLLFIPTSTNSFLVEQNNTNRCMGLDKTSVGVESCNVRDSRQHWIWTRNNQLVHVDSLKCLQLGHQHKTSGYWYIILEECNSAERRQLWKCQNEGQTFSSTETSIKEKILYLDKTQYVWGTIYLSLKETKWKRSGSSGETLCSKAFGCEGFVDSAILLTETRNCAQQCLVEKEIDVPHSGKNLCFIMWEELQYLDKDEWKQLLFRDQIFTIEKRNTNKMFLQLDYAKATSNWSGLIVKLHFYCAARKLTQVNTTEIKCVVIKFNGTIEERRTYPTSVPPTVSTTMTVFTNFTTGAAEKSQSGSPIVLVIVVCVVVAILILCGILGFIFYKRRRRSAENKGTYSPASRRSGDTTNPIYTPANDQDMYQDPDTGASRECELYESSENNEYADVEKNGQRPPPQEHQYDYAKNDNIRPVPQERLLPKDQSHNHPRNTDVTSKGKASNSKEEQSQTPVYQMLEAP